MKEIDKNNKSFEAIKHVDEDGVEFWYARELQAVLDYKEWRKFEGVIKKAEISCKNSGIDSFDHFVGIDKMVQIGSDAERKQQDYKLSRYACYLIAQNNGETADDIAKRKGLRYREDILDNMGSEELAANLFRITQTESRLKFAYF